MDIERIIGDLKAERDRLVGIIVALERLHVDGAQPTAPKRRGRKFMDKKGRKEVSDRMKRYWAGRRNGTVGTVTIAETEGTPKKDEISSGTSATVVASAA